jgi:Tetratricopeptide repeat
VIVVQVQCFYRSLTIARSDNDMTRCQQYLILVLSLLGAFPAFAGVRDAELGINGKAALSLVRFDGQPGKASITSGAEGVTVLITGVSARKQTITPPDTHIINAIDINPVKDGVRLVYHFNTAPIGGKVEVFERAILVKAMFERPLQMQMAGLNFGRAARSMSYASTTSPKPHAQSASATHTPDAPTSPANKTPDTNTASLNKAVAAPAPGAKVDTKKTAANPEHASTEDHHTNDAAPHDTAPKTPKPAEKRGTGMVREASVKIAPPTLDEKTCTQAQKAIENDPWALDKLSLYGACIAKEGRKSEAKEVFERLLTFDPDMITAYMGLGAIAQQDGDIKTARRHYEQALSLGGTDAQANRIRAALRSLDKKS